MHRSILTIFLLAMAGLTTAATPEEAQREANNLLQTGKPEAAWVSVGEAVKANPGAAESLRPVAMQALAEVLTRVDSLRKRNSHYEGLRLLGPVWTTLIDASASAPLFESNEAYEAKIQEVYEVVFDCTYRMAQQQLKRGDTQRAILYADYCLKLKPGDPDPRAVQLKAEIEAQSKVIGSPTPLGSATPTVTAGKEFVLKTLTDDGHSSTNDNKNHPEARAGSAKIFMCLSFPDVAIPQGAKIKSASLRVYVFGQAKWAVNTPFGATILNEDTDNGQGVSDQTPLVHLRPVLEKPAVQWLIASPSQGWVESPDIARLIQKTVNRPGWKAGNRLNLIFRQGRGSIDFTSFEQDPGRSFRLVVDWQ